MCSPYIRAKQTAETIASELGIDLEHIKIIDELRERGLGDCEGKPKTQASEWYSQSDGPTLEPRQELLNRMHHAVAKIAAISKQEQVLAVDHAISGFFLVEAAGGAKTIADTGADKQIGNADFIEVQIA